MLFCEADTKNMVVLLSVYVVRIFWGKKNTKGIR